MRKGFTLIEVILAMVITLMMVMVASTIIINVMQTFNSEAEVIDVRGDLSLIEARLEGIFRNENSDIIIYEEVSSIPTNPDYVCYYYNISVSGGQMKVVNDSNTSDAVGFPKDLSNKYEISAINFSEAVIDNGIKISFRIQLKGESTNKLYQELTLSTLNPYNTVERPNSKLETNNNILCFK